MLAAFTPIEILESQQSYTQIKNIHKKGLHSRRVPNRPEAGPLETPFNLNRPQKTKTLFLPGKHHNGWCF